MELRIACAFNPEGLDAYEADTAGRNGADIMVLPELADGGYARLHIQKGPAPNVSALTQRFSSFSERQHLTLISGTIALPDDDGRLSNTSLIYRNGHFLGKFSKIHLFRPLQDNQFFYAGYPRDTLTLDCRGVPVRIGVIVCYDLRFPELVRPWFKSGLDILFVPARWPRVRDDVWRVLLQARAMENQCFVVGVDSRDDEGGGSYAFGPDGSTVFSMGPDPEPGEPVWRSFTINLDEITRVKSRLDTRPDACLL